VLGNVVNSKYTKDNMSAEPDELYTLRNLYWLGNYQLAINEANGLNRLRQDLVHEKDEYLYRSYLALGQSHIIISEIKDSPSTPLGEPNPIRTHTHIHTRTHTHSCTHTCIYINM